MKALIVIIISFFLFIIPGGAQELEDTLQAPSQKEPSAIAVLFKGKPGRAFLYSLIIPGAGQVYNRRIWKVPIIYAALGGLVYAVHFNSKQYKRFDRAYRSRVDTDNAEPKLDPIDEFNGILSLQGINSYRQYYDKNLQLSYIGIGIVYLLNGIEAFVDRHLQDFDVSKNLSFNYSPDLYSPVGQLSIRLSF